MAKILDFKYQSSPEKEVQEVSLLQMVRGESFSAGINLNKLSEDERKQLMEIQEKYEADTKPYMKAYRRYNDDKVVKEEPGQVEVPEDEDPFK